MQMPMINTVEEFLSFKTEIEQTVNQYNHVVKNQQRQINSLILRHMTEIQFYVKELNQLVDQHTGDLKRFETETLQAIISTYKCNDKKNGISLLKNIGLITFQPTK